MNFYGYADTPYCYLICTLPALLKSYCLDLTGPRASNIRSKITFLLLLQWFEFTINSTQLKMTPCTANGHPRPENSDWPYSAAL